MAIVMRAYFEKPRTTTGWKGLIPDPFMDGSNSINAGLERARQILILINAMGLPTATEFLDPLVPQYIDDLVSWAAIGARTTESQTHRSMASGLAMPVGFKNGTDGSVQIAIDAMRAARGQHSFLGIDKCGRTAIVETLGNPWGHVVLRGSNGHTNYDRSTLLEVKERLTSAKLPQAIMVDCSHGNSHKNHKEQETAWSATIEQFLKGDVGVIGAMLESNLKEGNQSLPTNLTGFDAGRLEYGVSVTDACIGWEQTERMLGEAFKLLKKHKRH
jgi:3-deoxy-7-phosphoheptulonate synthase